MTSSPMASPRRSFDIPKPEDGLAEWTSKIRALQQQVDADEEAEHRRLEEEIAASRLARMRRSRGIGYGSGSRTSSVEIDKDKVSSLKEDKDSSTMMDDMGSIAERQKGQQDALRKLMGSSASVSGSERVTPPVGSARAEPMSLAAFMGGRTTGPRLNKHAPQQNAHDPTQFEQRTSITSPHPVFGRGGVAMPGMAKPSKDHLSYGRETDTPVALGRKKSQPELRPSPEYVPTRERNDSAPSLSKQFPSSPSAVPPRPNSVTSRYMDAISERPISPQKSGGRARERTMSTPYRPPSDRGLFPSSSSNVSRTSFHDTDNPPISPQKSGSRERRLSTPGRTSPTKGVSFVLPSDSEDAEPYRNKRASLGNTSRPKTPTSDSSVSKSPPHRPIVEMPSLARTIQPQPRSPSNVPQISASPTPSPAFLKAPAPKEPTPSLSRLAGRGFVQNMVKATQQWENQTPSTQTTPEKQVPGRKATVLDRWQPREPTNPSPSPPISPKPAVMRKSWTTETAPSTSPAPAPSKPLRSATSFTSFRQNVEKNLSQPSEEMKGVGSATTLVVFKPAPVEEEATEFADVDELGMKPKAASILGGKLPAQTGKPLIHPTKERAKKPKKSTRTTSKSEHVIAEPQVSLSSRTESSVRATSPKNDHETVAENDHPQPPKLTPPSSNGVRSGKVTDRWLDQPIIGVKPVLSRESSQSEALKVSGLASRKPLPGLVSSPALPSTFNPINRAPSKSPDIPGRSTTDSSSSSAPKSPGGENSRPITPVRHTRIPSTGNRATVMDIAQAFDQESVQAPKTESPTQEEQQPTMEVTSPISSSADESSRQSVFPVTLERRRSVFEKFSAPSLPPLKEESTPISSPAATLARPDPEDDKARQPLKDIFNNDAAQDLPSSSQILPSSAPSKGSKVIPSQEGSKIVHLAHIDQPLPSVDYNAVIKSRRIEQRKSSDTNTISVEVMSIVGNSSTALSKDINIFHDSEVLAIVHRFKSKSSGLVGTIVWGWFGKNSQSGEREAQKLEELAKRYGTSMVMVNQNYEPTDLVQILGGQMFIRQGPRAHWSSENTAMHVVRSRNGLVFIDELDLNIKNLCSGFSYCLTLLDTVYVWHGRGSTDLERRAALQYGRLLSSNIVEFIQGINDEEEMFWMVLGEGEFAIADYWRWKRMSPEHDPRIWLVDASQPGEPVATVDFLQNEIARDSVHVVDCIWEFFVVVGSRARGKRTDIRLALAVATELSVRLGRERPFTPTVHTVVFPSQVPLDLKAHIREMDESFLNDNDIPDHMNILPREDALDHLRRRSWEEFALRDRSMLPLGMAPL
ncbi:gelsolin repeat [Moniliophthora roreri]|nr:gelsolin repeat [Moniliophthora roreri]